MFEEFVATRDAYGEALLQLGKKNEDVVVLDADLSKSTRTQKFAKEFPERFFDVGIAEANMISIASGLSSMGKIPFVSSFACFLICKAFDQLRMSVTYPRSNVKVVVSHGGISIGEDGPSQQSVEDIALARALPGMVVMVPSDKYSTISLVRQAAEHEGPVFMRTGRMKVPVIYKESESFIIGKAKVVSKGSDVAVIACGIMVAEAMQAARDAEKKGINVAVIDMHTIKPIDEEIIKEYAIKCGAIVTAEEHLLSGGLGEAVSRAILGKHPVPVEYVGLKDTYAESGTPKELLNKYHLTSADILDACQKAINRK